MAFVPLNGGFYTSRSLLAAAQSSVNLFAERMPQGSGEPAQTITLPTPGIRLLGLYGNGSWRCLYRASNGGVYGVVGSQVSYVSDAMAVTSLGTLPTLLGPVCMSDNGTDLVIVDGSPRGWVVNLATNVMTEIISAAFYGADRVACIDGFFAFNRTGTNQFYLSNAIATTFNPLYVAAKAGLDRLVSLAVVERELWLFGETKTEIYSNTGAADFPLASMSGGIEQGCTAPHSVARPDGSVIWLGRSREGIGVVFQGRRYQAERVSTHAIEHVIQGYATINDAVAWTYQVDGHTIYALCFPTADATWCYDLATKLWHQWSSTDNAIPGLHRHRGNCEARGAGTVLVGDWQNGNLYALETTALTDNGVAIQRTRAFPHIEIDAHRVFHTQLVVDLQCGTVATGQPEPLLTLRWSDTQGASWSLPVTAGMGAAGAGDRSLSFRRLGMSRSRIYEVGWSAAVQTVLLGAWLDAGAAAT